ncbi:phosphate/phosphite/phosphonate ABC transporter substrate-binding protein [Nitratireductor sp. ZSWI3]|uniref:phosphate/phosphite/phosphonate ABC transporter substrate-binding protein n=1 Tax=Nitratireductor sp. ZSWI3 TaxID=2966359 RepID=UPI00214FAE26|nr:PhnD/SsuA/transferrin family substrate-binding protein [Nitratireductor sp. ZSWI3]MCR4266248.1 PhnD/SsuA/transferrin family substrate-binding protein [Nitratireductor sp. ZSWI3]
MRTFSAAAPGLATLPMYDWPECRAATDAQWHQWRDALSGRGIGVPEDLTRSDDLQALWRDPRLLLGQTCWGPMEAGLQEHVQVIGQPDYSDFEGGEGPLYSSVILMRDGEGVPAPQDGAARLPLGRLRGVRFAYNDMNSMSGLFGISRDLNAAGESLAIFAARLATGAHRASIVAVAEGRADVCAVDCRSWVLAREHEPAASALCVVGWTARRPGLPYITSRSTDPATLEALRAVLGVVADGA